MIIFWGIQVQLSFSIWNSSSIQTLCEFYSWQRLRSWEYVWLLFCNSHQKIKNKGFTGWESFSLSPDWWRLFTWINNIVAALTYFLEEIRGWVFCFAQLSWTLHVVHDLCFQPPYFLLLPLAAERNVTKLFLIFIFLPSRWLHLLVSKSTFRHN